MLVGSNFKNYNILTYFVSVETIGDRSGNGYCVQVGSVGSSAKLGVKHCESGKKIVPHLNHYVHEDIDGDDDEVDDDVVDE